MAHLLLIDNAQIVTSADGARLAGQRPYQSGSSSAASWLGLAQVGDQGLRRGERSAYPPSLPRLALRRQNVFRLTHAEEVGLRLLCLILAPAPDCG